MTPQSAARLSLGASIGLLALKYAAYLFTGSVALYSDALESIVNVVGGALASVAVWYSSRPADRSHPYGHSKVEYLCAGIEGSLIAVAAISIIRTALPRLAHPAALEGLGAGVAFSVAATGLNAALAATMVRTGRRHRSPALVGNGMHIWSDVWTSGGVLVGVGLAWATRWWILDPLLAIIVAVNILRVGWRVIRDSLGGLMDEALPADALGRIESVTVERCAGAGSPHDITARRAGARTFVEMHLHVPAAMTVAESHRVVDSIEMGLAEALGDVRVTVHVEPDGE